MGTSPRLVKAGAAPQPQTQPAPPKHFTNWSRQFLAEYAAEQAAKLPARVQFENLFQSKEVVL